MMVEFSGSSHSVKCTRMLLISIRMSTITASTIVALLLLVMLV